MRRERECGGKKEIIPERRRGEEREPDKSEKRGREAFRPPRCFIAHLLRLELEKLLYLDLSRSPNGFF
jgi:hypothetical protein